MRINFIDNAKSIGILLVLFGHAPGVPRSVLNFIYSFHMPVFFFISGYLLNEKKLNVCLLEYIKIQFRSIVFPYFFYGLISLLYSIPSNMLKARNFDLFSSLNGLFYGTSDGLVNITLWFFTCLFSVSFYYYFLSKILHPLIIALISFICGLIICQYSFYRLPWNLDLAVICLFFFSIGRYVASRNIPWDSLVSFPFCNIIFMITVLLLLLLSDMNGRVDLAFMKFSNVILFYINSCLGIISLVMFSAFIPPSSFFLWLSRNTIVIFPLHPLINSVITGTFVVIFRYSQDFANNLWWSVFYISLALAACYPISVFIFKYIPCVSGRR